MLQDHDHDHDHDHAQVRATRCDLNLIRPFQGPWIPSTDTGGSNKVIKDSNKPENENRAISFLAQ